MNFNFRGSLVPLVATLICDGCNHDVRTNFNSTIYAELKEFSVPVMRYHKTSAGSFSKPICNGVLFNYDTSGIVFVATKYHALFEGDTSGDLSVDINSNTNLWHEIHVDTVICSPQWDIAILSLGEVEYLAQLGVTPGNAGRDISLSPSDKKFIRQHTRIPRGIHIGQADTPVIGEDVYSVGYPMVAQNIDFPVVRRGMIAKIDGMDGDFILDGMSNALFSGSPVYGVKGGKIQLYGIIRFYYQSEEAFENKPSYNTGLIFCTSAGRIIKLLNESASRAK
jgi:hypothetical protein